MKIKIVTDSASNMLSLDGIPFQSVPLKIITNVQEYVDDANLSVSQMVNDLAAYKGKSSTACPGVGEWLEAFEDYDIVFCVTIISTLSGSYNAAMTAKKIYEEDHPDRHVFVLDSYSAGAEMKLHIEKFRDLALAGKDFDTICKEIQEYKEQHTALIFCLESLRNLANNGRVSPAVAKIASILGIRMVGDVSPEGQLHPTDKCRGEKKAVAQIFTNMKAMGYKGGKLYIDHCSNEGASVALKDAVLAQFPQANVVIDKTRALCSFYAEKGGLMIGFEIN
ncbi:MAG: DegV family protein [Firmicutes bacterium]|nr:DegV family protein [Bacillota bacterium]